MSTRQKMPTPVERLMAAMDRCAVARGEAQWTNGYRAAKGGEEADRMYAQEWADWQAVKRAEKAFRRLARRLLRAAPAAQRGSRSLPGDEQP